MTTNQIKDLQRKIGTEPDGFWGNKSIAACQAHLRKLMPKGRFPTQAQVSSGKSIFGPHGVPNGYAPSQKKITLPFPLWLYGNPMTATYSLSPHEKCADALLSVFQRLAEVYKTTEERKAAGILCFDGTYNPRPMRGGSAWSMHAWAIAIDLNADKNGNATSWPAKAVMPLEVMECFAAEGFLAAGAFWGRDAMHFQATSV